MTRLDDHIRRLANRNAAWPIPWVDVQALGRSEDCRLVAYRCIAGVPSIGWGETEGITLDMRWTPDQADARFTQQLTRYTRKVEALCTESPNENQLGALVRLGYNIGLAALARSTALRQHNAGNAQAAARAMLLWDKYTDPATGQHRTSPVLAARRAAEAARYLAPVEGAPTEPMPQAIAPESKLTASPIAQGGAVTAAAGATTLASQIDDAQGLLASAKALAAQAAEIVGVPLPVLLGAVLLAAGVVCLVQRHKQRQGGWA